MDCYRQLRQADTLGRNRSCYRITVRQLESLVRLSEALARLHLDDEVRARYVHEAHRLLKTSIIHVEADDVVLDGDDDDDDDNDLGGGGRAAGEPDLGSAGGGEGGGEDGGEGGGDFPRGAGEGRVGEGEGEGMDEGGGSGAAPAPKRARLTIPNEQFKEIARMVGRHLNELDEKGEAKNGVALEEVVTWYLEQREEEIDSEEKFEVEKEIVHRVIKNLLTESVGTLIYIGAPPAPGASDDQAMIALHPSIDPRQL